MKGRKNENDERNYFPLHLSDSLLLANKIGVNFPRSLVLQTGYV